MNFVFQTTLFSLQLELEQLRTKLERLEKEKNEYKSVADRLDTKVSTGTSNCNNVLINHIKSCPKIHHLPNTELHRWS